MLMTSAISFPGLGIEVNPSRVAFYIPGLDKPVYWYGIVIAAGLLLAYFFMTKKAPKFGLSGDNVLDMILWAVPVGLIGARIYYCVFYWELFRDNPISCLYIWEGGLAIYGGVIAGVLGLICYSRKYHKPLGVVLDVASFGVIIGQICGRWGNFFNREAYGRETSCFLRMGLTGADGVTRYYHPTFLYESLWNLVGFFLMNLLAKKRKFDGQIVTFYLIWYGIGRAWIEGMRTDSLYLFGTGIRVSQLLAVLCAVLGTAFMLWKLLAKHPDPAGLFVNVQKAAGSEQSEKTETPPEQL